MEEQVILVNEFNEVTGSIGKLEAHQKGLLHRAFSVFIFNSKKELLLQQRADGKYHSAGLWSNTVCSHPRADETGKDAAIRRLSEEMGMRCELHFLFDFIYKAKLDNGLIEFEFDEVYWGLCDAEPQPNPEEVQNWKYISVPRLLTELKAHPERYTYWLNTCFEDVIRKLHL